MPVPSVPSQVTTILATKTYDSLWFSGGSIEEQIQTAINAAAADGAERVLVHGPYNASLIAFNLAIQMVREGGDWSVYDVKAYGAAGDGIQDDTIAIQATHDNMPTGNRMYIPGVSTFYKITKGIGSGSITAAGILLTKSIELFGDGVSSLIKQTDIVQANVLSALNANNIVIRDLAVTGNQISGGGSGLINNGIHINACTDALVQNCIVTNGELCGIQVAGVSHRTRIIDNIISGTNATNFESNSADIAVLIPNCDDVLIQGNRCLSTNKSNGIIGQTTATGQSFRRARIIGNYVTSPAQAGGSTTGHGIIIYTLYTGGVTISDAAIEANVVKDCAGIGIYIQGGGVASSCPNMSIIGNKCINCVTVGTGGTLLDGAISLLDAPNTVVVGNGIKSGGAALGTSYGIRVGAGSHWCTITGNTIDTFTGNGIAAFGTAAPNYGTISGNTVHGVNQGIYLEHGIGWRVIGNICDTCSGSGILLNTTVIDTTIEANYVRACSNAALTVGGAGCLRTQWYNNIMDSASPGGFFSDAGTGTIRRGNRLSTGASQGIVTLTAANPAATVSTVEVQTGDKIILSRHTAGGTLGHLSIGTITNGTSFTIVASGNLDTSTIDWEIIH